MLEKSAVLTTKPTTASTHHKNVAKIEKLQDVIQTGIFRPKTEFSRTSILLGEMAKSGRSAKFRTDILIDELVRIN